MRRNSSQKSIKDLNARIAKFVMDLRTANSRYKRAKARHLEAKRLYRNVDAIYTDKENRIRREMDAKLASGFRITLVTSLVSLFEVRLQEETKQLHQAQSYLSASRTQMEQALSVHQAARAALTEAFAKKDVSVPYIVEKATMPTAQVLQAEESECKRREKNMEQAKHLVAEKLKWVQLYSHDLKQVMEAERKLSQAKLQRMRQKAHHEQMLMMSQEAMSSAKTRINNIERRIRAIAMEQQRLK